MRKLVQQSALVHMLDIEDNVSISATTSDGDDVLVEGKGDEDHDDDQVDDGADGAHALGQLLLVVDLGHVAAPEAGADEGRAQPADHGVAGGKGQAAEGERRDEGLAIAAKGVGEDGDAGDGESAQAQSLAVGELGRQLGSGRRRHGFGVGSSRRGRWIRT